MKLVKPLTFVPLMFLLFFSSCKKKESEKNNSTQPGISVSDALPVVKTSVASAISETAALSGGTITSNTLKPILSSGVCWAKHPNPGLSDPHNLDQTPGLGSFTCAVFDLEAYTTYYVRAYATNEYGTGYGNEISFKTKGVWLTSPLNVSVTAMTNIGNTIFVISSSDVYISSNEGVSWYGPVYPFNGSPASCVVSSSSHVFAGTGIGIFRTDNNGTSWLSLTSGIGNVSVNKMAVSGNTLLAASSNSIFVSTNNGNSWSLSTTTLNAVVSLAIKGETLYAATQNSGIFLSTDMGLNWTSSNSGLNSNPFIGFLGINGAMLLVCTNAGLFISADNGTSWNKSSNAGGLLFSSFHCSANTTIYGDYQNKIYGSSDNGATFSEMGRGLPGSLFLSSYKITSTDKTLFAASGALYKLPLK